MRILLSRRHYLPMYKPDFSFSITTPSFWGGGDEPLFEFRDKLDVLGQVKDNRISLLLVKRNIDFAMEDQEEDRDTIYLLNEVTGENNIFLEGFSDRKMKPEEVKRLLTRKVRSFMDPAFGGFEGTVAELLADRSEEMPFSGSFEVEIDPFSREICENDEIKSSGLRDYCIHATRNAKYVLRIKPEWPGKIWENFYFIF